MRKHLFAVKQLPANQFLAEPGVALVDRWNLLKAKQDEWKAEIAKLDCEVDQIKEALKALAARDGMTKVVGSEKEVAITEEHRVMFPRKGQEPGTARRHSTCVPVLGSSQLPGPGRPICVVATT